MIKSTTFFGVGKQIVSFISINFKSKCVLCDVYSTHVLTIFHVHTFHGSKRDFPVTCAVTAFKI